MTARAALEALSAELLPRFEVHQIAEHLRVWAIGSEPAMDVQVFALRSRITVARSERVLILTGVQAQLRDEDSLEVRVPLGDLAFPEAFIPSVVIECRDARAVGRWRLHFELDEQILGQRQTWSLQHREFLGPASVV